MKPRHNHTFEALGTHWALETLGNNNLSDALIASVTRMVDQFTRDYSRFDTQSLVGTLNTAGTVQHPSEELLAMLAFAQEMFIASDGAFNISIGGALHKLGYGSQQQAARVWQNPWPAISIDNEYITIPPDMTIDFGGFGKGWLIDKLATLFTNSDITEFIINGGGDIYVYTSTPTEIGLEHPYDTTKTIGSTRISRGGLGVSSNTKRTWQKDGNTHAHILNPNEKLPHQERVISAYVRANSALLADTMATILLLRPDLEAQLTKTFDLKVILLTDDTLASAAA